jgi:hypothetical protein
MLSHIFAYYFHTSYNTVHTAWPFVFSSTEFDIKNVCGLVVIDIVYSLETLIFSWICGISSDINIIRMMMLTLNWNLQLKIKSSCLVYFTSNKYKNFSPFQHLQIELKWLKTAILSKMEFSELLGSNGYKTQPPNQELHITIVRQHIKLYY